MAVKLFTVDPNNFYTTFGTDSTDFSFAIDRSKDMRLPSAVCLLPHSKIPKKAETTNYNY